MVGEVHVALPRSSRSRRSTTSRSHLESRVTGGQGDGHLQRLSISTRKGEERTVETQWLFVFIGAKPYTSWLGDTVERDDKGFLLTGPGSRTRWSATA